METNNLTKQEFQQLMELYNKNEIASLKLFRKDLPELSKSKFDDFIENYLEYSKKYK